MVTYNSMPIMIKKHFDRNAIRLFVVKNWESIHTLTFQYRNIINYQVITNHFTQDWPSILPIYFLFFSSLLFRLFAVFHMYWLIPISWIFTLCGYGIAPFSNLSIILYFTQHSFSSPFLEVKYIFLALACDVEIICWLLHLKIPFHRDTLKNWIFFDYSCSIKW